MANPPTTIVDSVIQKEVHLKKLIVDYGSLAVAYSGGVDSTYLSDVSSETLGPQARILLADSPSIPRSEVAEATELARARGWNFEVIETNEFENEEYLQNNGTRCYHCRAELFTKMQQYARDNGVRVLAYGAIVDDLFDPTRLGAKAAEEFQVVAPLQEAELTKDDIRQLSTRRDLPTADKASFACLSSRLPVGTRVDVETLAKVEAAEEVLRQASFRQYRARHHGDICRIEIDPADFERLADPETRAELVKGVRAAGYRYVTLDLA